MSSNRGSSNVTHVPIISICIPTYNRANGLRNLFRNLHEIKRQHGDDIDICISNNNSSDGTTSVILEWQEVLKPTVSHQETNIGATLNIIAVTRLSIGKWTLLVGDDDELIPENFSLLLQYLEVASPNDWVLAGIADTSGREHILGDLKSGKFKKKSFRMTVLKTSLHRYGFMGMHIFPASARHTLSKLTLIEAKPWPPIALFLREMEDGYVHVFKPTIMIQAQGGAKLFWNAADLAKITISRIRIINKVANRGATDYFFHGLLMLREIYSIPNGLLLIAWKIYESADYQRHAMTAYLGCYRLTGILMPLTIPHFGFVLLLRFLPHFFLKLLLRGAGKEHYLSRYASRKDELQAFDGIRRGL